MLKCLNQLKVLNVRHKLEKLDKPCGADDNNLRVSEGSAEVLLETLTIISECKMRVEGRSQEAREEQATEGNGEGCGWREARPVRLALVPIRILWIIYNFISTCRIKCKYNRSRFFSNKSHESSLIPFFGRITGPKNRGKVAAVLHHDFRNAFVLARWCSYILSNRMWKRLNHTKVGTELLDIWHWRASYE